MCHPVQAGLLYLGVGLAGFENACPNSQSAKDELSSLAASSRALVRQIAIARTGHLSTSKPCRTLHEQALAVCAPRAQEDPCFRVL
jgi:hypothetical protein